MRRTFETTRHSRERETIVKRGFVLLGASILESMGVTQSGFVARSKAQHKSKSYFGDITKDESRRKHSSGNSSPVGGNGKNRLSLPRLLRRRTTSTSSSSSSKKKTRRDGTKEVDSSFGVNLPPIMSCKQSLPQFESDGPVAVLAAQRSTPQSLRQVLFQRSQSMSALWAHKPNSDEYNDNVDDDDDDDNNDDVENEEREIEKEEQADEQQQEREQESWRLDSSVDADGDGDEESDDVGACVSLARSQSMSWVALKSIAGPVGLEAPPPPQKPSLPSRRNDIPSIRRSGSLQKPRQSIKRMLSLPADVFLPSK